AKKLFESFRRRIISTAPPGARPLVAASVTSSASVHSFQGLGSMRRTIRQCRAGGNTPKKGSVRLVDTDFRPRKNLFLQAHMEAPQEIVLDLDNRTISEFPPSFYIHFEIMNVNCRGPTMLATGIR